ncbi:MAG: serine/threonine protein kinase [Deltaproteobacteria bacterium]|nr:serine/threonine protein kinase [Deltaproteobacteria bacterium]
MSGQKPRLGPFVFVDELALGSTSRILRARYRPRQEDGELPLERGVPVVLKVMRSEMDDAAAFTREAEILSLLDHPGLLRLITKGLTSSRLWMALEYVEGESLQNVMQALEQDERRLRPELALRIVGELLEAVSAAHTLVDPRGVPVGLVHCDLSPNNVLIDIHGHVRVLDFGASYLSAREPPPGNVIGSPGYLAPEVAQGVSPTPRSDVYQIGLLLFELLTGRRAYHVQGQTDAAALEAHANASRAPWPTTISIPAQIKALVDQALETDPARRLQDAGAFYHRLAPLLSQHQSEESNLIRRIATDLISSNSERPAPFFI